MKILVLGGAGDMGSYAVRDLAKFSSFGRITIADQNINLAKKIAEELIGRVKVDAIGVDAKNHSELVKAMNGYDVVLSCLGPFYVFEEKAARAAAEAGANYISICDDFDAAENFFELDGLFKKNRLKAITGVGWTPGVSNILIVKGILGMGSAERVNVSWVGSSSDSRGLAVIMHTLHIFNGMIKTFLNGKYAWLKAGTGRKIVEFLPPVGKVPVYHVGHPEPVTIPRVFKNLKEVTLKGTVLPLVTNDLAKLFSKLKMTATVERRARVAKYAHAILPFLNKLPLLKAPAISGLRVDVYGTSSGQPSHFVARTNDHMDRLTAIPASVGASLLASDSSERYGAHSPEGFFEPEVFLEELAKRQIQIVYGKG